VDDIDEQSAGPPPPAPVDVVRRALILSAVVCRSHLENYKDEEYRRQTVEYIREWFDELDLWPHLEPSEEKIIRADFWTIPNWLRARGTWYVEGLAMLAWALKRAEFPPHDEKVDPIAVTDALGFLDPDAGKMLEAPRLRKAVEIKAAREWVYDVHCTLRGFLHHDGDGHLAKWIVDYLRDLKIAPAKVMIKGHLAFKGKSLQKADRGELEDWEHIVCERHRAVIWLEGDEELFTELSVDT